MTPAETILRLIEAVTPDDDTIAKIEGKFWCYLEEKQYHAARYGEVFWKKPDDNSIYSSVAIPQYARSLDAQAAIMPKGWYWHSIIQEFDDFQAALEKSDQSCYCHSPILPTEPLARLHALIQALEYIKSQEAA